MIFRKQFCLSHVFRRSRDKLIETNLDDGYFSPLQVSKGRQDNLHNMTVLLFVTTVLSIPIDVFASNLTNNFVYQSSSVVDHALVDTCGLCQFADHENSSSSAATQIRQIQCRLYELLFEFKFIRDAHNGFDGPRFDSYFNCPDIWVHVWGNNVHMPAKFALSWLFLFVLCFESFSISQCRQQSFDPLWAPIHQ